MSQEWRIPLWFQSLEPRALERLRIYSDDLTKWTKKVNLISPGTVAEADRIHFADAILGSEYFLKELPEEAEVWDLGSGNGIPGLVISILRPDLKMCCLDSDERKIGFIKQLGLRLELKNLKTLCSRLENLADGEISLATARGFAPLKRVLSVADSKFSSKAVIYHFKGQEFQLELDEIPEKAKEVWKTVVLGEYKLPLDGGSRSILKSIKG
jgi:16S rRNA (guanine527-N7)-methyltransferase